MLVKQWLSYRPPSDQRVNFLSFKNCIFVSTRKSPVATKKPSWVESGKTACLYQKLKVRSSWSKANKQTSTPNLIKIEMKVANLILKLLVLKFEKLSMFLGEMIELECILQHKFIWPPIIYFDQMRQILPVLPGRSWLGWFLYIFFVPVKE